MERFSKSLDLENLTNILNKNQFSNKLVNRVKTQYLNLKFDKKPTSYHALENIPTLPKNMIKTSLKCFVKIKDIETHTTHDQ